MYKSLQLDGGEVLDVDVAHLVFFALVDVPERAKQSEVFWLSTNHLGGQIEVLEDTVVADHHWHDRHLLSDSRKGLKGVQEPANRHVSVCLAGELSGPESRCVLEDGYELIVRDELFQKGTVDVAAL